MSLLVWLPLIKDTNNQGVADTTITTTGTITYSAGKLGNALTFNNSALTLKPAPITGSTSEFSFAFWYKPTDITNSHCIYNGRATVGGAVSIFRVSANTFRFDDGAQHTFTYKTVKDTWQHIAFTRDNTSIKLYVNGVLNQTMTSSSFTSAGTTASIGMSSTSGTTPSGNAIAGQINDYRIYDHALSIKEIKELAKGLMTHVPLSWGANSNMIKNSYTWMNKAMGTTNGTSSTMVVTKSFVEDNTAPCHWALKVSCANSGSATGAWVGPYFPRGTQGLATADLVSGETYTYSFWAKLDSSSSATTTFVPSSIVESQTLVSSSGFEDLSSNWRKHTVTFKWTSTGKLTACFYASIPANATVTYYLCGIKLEKGDKATPYVPHVEEVAYTNNGYATLYSDDCSGYNRPYTISTGSGGSVSIGTESPRGTGTNFGYHQIYFEQGFPIGTTPKFTLAFWQKGIAATQTRYSDVIWLGVGNSSSTAMSARLRLETISTDGTSSGYVWYGNGVVTASGGMCGLVANPGTWRHVVLTFDGSVFRQYVNGAQLNTHTLASDYAGFKTYGQFGIGDASANIQVELADVRVYATALSADDIKELYNVAAQIDKSGNVYCSNFVEV